MGEPTSAEAPTLPAIPSAPQVPSELFAQAIARAVAVQLGQVRITATSDSQAPPRSSIRVAAHATATATRVGMAVLGVLVVAAEVAAAELLKAHYPHLQGPLRALLEVFLRMLSEGPTP